MKRSTRAKLVKAALYGVIVVVALLVGFYADWEKIGNSFFNREIARDMFPEVLTTAAKNTVVLTFLAFVFGLILALALALMKLSSIKLYRWLAIGYIELFRGLPALVTLIFVGFAIPIAFGFSVPGGALGQGTIGLALVAGAYMAETIRAGIEAVPKGQMEAARSLGMSWTTAMMYIVLPQAFRIIVPPLTNELVLLIKDTSLVFVLGTTPASKELTKFGRDLMTKEFNGTPLMVIAAVYLLITLPLTYLVSRLEKKTAAAR